MRTTLTDEIDFEPFLPEDDGVLDTDEKNDEARQNVKRQREAIGLRMECTES